MIGRNTAAVAAILAACLGLVSCRDDGGPSNVPPPTIQVLSNRADQVSGGDALVEVKLPPGIPASALQVTVGGRDVSAQFVARPALNGRIVGLLTGLANGANVVVASASGSASSLTITNYPVGGPILLNSQVTPWVCATPTAVAASGNTPQSNASGLSTAAIDAQCNIATEFRLFYRTLTPVTATVGDNGCSFVLPDPSPAGTPTPANSCFQPYVVGTTPAASVASTTTSNGVTLPYIVRVERGTVDRGIYDIAVLFDPTKPTWTAVSPQPQWNGKVIYSYGASSSIPRLQFRSEQNWAVAFINGFWDDSALRAGYMVVDNSITDALYNTNRVLTAEATMMMKEHIVDTYGEIRYMMGNGGSGGAINQNLVASIYPGLLDGIQTSVVFPDSLTTATEVADCSLLVNYYATPQWAALVSGLTQAQVNAKKAAINGHRDQLGCHGWNNAFAGLLQPGNYAPRLVVDASGTIVTSPTSRNNCSLPAALVYDPASNPTGTRCTETDGAPGVWGTTTSLAGGSSTRALTVLDNVGVQYGLKALLSGVIAPEEFVTLNERIGGFDTDAKFVASRSVADAAALPIAYRSGLVASGKNLAKVAIIDSRGFDEGPTAINNIHFNWRSYELRARLDADAGGHGNDAIWRYAALLLPTTPPQVAAVTTFSFTTMDAWLSNLLTTAPKATLNAERTPTQVVAAKPAAAVDFCFLTPDTNYTTRITDQSVCDADPSLKVYSSPHQVAGGPLAENILKCTLKPLAFGDYPGITFTATQQARLNATFASGVCDWSRPGVGQQDPTTPITFAGGPGGVPLGPPPASH